MSLVKILRWFLRESLLLGFDIGPISLVFCFSIFCWKPHIVCGFIGVHQRSLLSSRIIIFTICSWACSMFHLISTLNSYAVNTVVFTALHYIYKMPSATCCHSMPSVSTVSLLYMRCYFPHIWRQKSYLYEQSWKESNREAMLTTPKTASTFDLEGEWAQEYLLTLNVKWTTVEHVLYSSIFL